MLEGWRCIFIKRFIICIILLSLITSFVSCSKTDPQENDPLGWFEDENKEYTIYDGEVMLVIPSQSEMFREQEVQHVIEWEKYIYDKYDLKINLEYTLRDKKTNRIILDEIEDIGRKDGLIYVSDYEDIPDLLSKGLIQPLNSIIEDIDSIKNIESGLYDNFTDKNGNIWAIPLYERTNVSARIYNSDWLFMANMGIPETIGDFYELAEYIAVSDPDGDGEKNTYITWYSYSSFPDDFRDIFKAFGVYSDGFPGLISYNPLKSKYEISAFNENFEDLMLYLKQLKDNFLIKKADYPTRRDYDNQNFEIGSSYSADVIDPNEAEYGYVLRGNNSKGLLKSNYVPALVVLKDTGDISQKLEAIYTTLNGNKESEYDFKFGIKGQDYFDKGTHYEVLNRRENLWMLSYISISTKFNEGGKINKPVIVENSSYGIDYMRNLNIHWTSMRDGADIYHNTDTFYFIPFYIQDSSIRKINMDLAGHEYQLYEDIMTRNIPVGEAVESLREKIKELGIFEILDELNGN